MTSAALARRRVPALSVLLLAGGLAPRAALAERTLSDEILDSKYRRGDYGFYLSWHDPWGAQFDTHGSYALPIGGKVRFRLAGPFRAEVDMSYYRKGGEAPPRLLAYDTPQFDGVVVVASLQAAGGRLGPVRPYAGAGPAFVSLGNDFAADLRALGLLSPDRRRLMSWSEVDLGLQLTAGLDLAGTRRVFPFVEYRHLIGELEIGEFRDGLLTRKPEDLVNVDGTDVTRKYDWSGPGILAGLRIRF